MKLDLNLEELFESPIDVVWRAVTDPRMLARWLMENDFEPRVGHRFTLRDPPKSKWRGWVDCEVLELDPPRRMVWSWIGGMAFEQASRVTFELRSEGANTRLILRHEGDAVAECEPMRAGWIRMLNHLRGVLGPDYTRRVAFRASRARVFDAIATIEGLRGWWTPIVSGSPFAGGELRFEFGHDEHIIMCVTSAERPSSVRWSCATHTELPDWRGTQVLFELAEHGDESTLLTLQHVGLTEHLDCYESCQRGWDYFLGSMVKLVERGEGTPWRSAVGRPSRALS